MDIDRAANGSGAGMDAELQRQIRLQELLMEVSTALISITPNEKDAAIDQYLERLGTFVCADRAYVFYYDYKREICINTNEWCAPGIPPQQPDLQAVPFSLVPAWIDAHRKGKTIHIPNVRALPAEDGVRHVLEPQGVQSVLSVPMMEGTDCIGFIGFDVVREPHTFSEMEQRLLGLLANMVVSVDRRLKIESALHEAEQRFLDVMHASDEAIVLVDENGFVDCNEATARHLGYPSREAFIKTERPATAPPTQPDGRDSVEKAKELERLAFETGFQRFEWMNRHADGHDFPADISITPVIFRGKPMIYCVWRDLTAIKQAEEEKEQLQAQLIQAQKLESVGRLAGGIAHDFNNMLSIIRGYVDLAIEELPEEHPVHEDLLPIRDAAERSSAITRQLLAFARKQTIAPQVIDLNTAVEALLDILRRLIGENIRFTWHPSNQSSLVYIDPAQIDQILTNLCVNAGDAVEDTGNVSIEVEQMSFDPSFCEIHSGFAVGEFVVLAVSDNGCGIPQESITHIFDPFYTTKAVGKGTGLGLSTVYGIVKQNNGFIKVYSEPGCGTTFKVFLPRYAGEEKEPVTPGDAFTPAGDETILVVEDNPTILALTARLLEQSGYQTLTACTPSEAIDTARSHADKIDLLVTDVVMPDMNGRDLAKNLMTHCPDIKCLFMSGYTANIIAHQGLLDKGVHFIQKPFTASTLTAKIRETLADTSS